MNPPFSAMANVERPHGRCRLSPCRLGAGASRRRRAAGRDHRREFRPEMPAWRDAFTRLQERGSVVFTAAIDGAVYAKHGTTIETRLTVIDQCRRRPGAVSAIRRGRAGRGDAARLDRRACPATSPDPGGAAQRAGGLPSRRAPFAAISRARPRRSRLPRSQSRKASSLPTRQSNGRRPRAPSHGCAL